MSESRKMKREEDGWLAAEHALGVLHGQRRMDAMALEERDLGFARDVQNWNSRFEPLLDDVELHEPPNALWSRIERELGLENTASLTDARAISATKGPWKLLSALFGTTAIGALGLLVFVTGGDLTGGTLRDLERDLAASKIEVNEQTQAYRTAQAALEQSNAQVQRLAESANTLTAENQRLAGLAAQGVPIVASLNADGSLPAFVAQYSPTQQALFIRTAREDSDELVPEVWLIPSEGARKGEAISLGVMDEKQPDTLKLVPELARLVKAGGTLAITMEPAGGAPNGVATSAPIAVGQLQSLDED